MNAVAKQRRPEGDAGIVAILEDTERESERSAAVADIHK